MRNLHPKLLVCLGAILLAAPVVLVARVDVKVEYDKKFDFKPVKTWAWTPDSPGDVKVARSEYDDKDAIKKEAEPIILDSVAAELKQRGLQQAQGVPDLAVTYYFLGIIYDQSKEYMDALANYQQFLKLADSEKNKLEIEKVNLRLPALQKQIKEKKGKK